MSRTICPDQPRPASQPTGRFHWLLNIAQQQAASYTSQPMLGFADVTLSRGSRTLLSGMNFTIHAGWRVGVVGRNGTGKSSLFALILGAIETDAGTVSLPRDFSIATVSQQTPESQRSALDYALDGNHRLREAERALAEAEAGHDLLRIAELHERLRDLDAHAAPAFAARLLHGLGFSAEDQQRPVSEFSGGWRRRLNLAQALLCPADLLLLDEPTNHLDLDAVLWLQPWLRNYAGTLMVISHDRDFLDAITTHTLHLHQRGATLTPGNYSQFERLRAERMKQQGALRHRQLRRIGELQGFVERFRAKASKARQAQARLKMIERIQLAAPAYADSEFEFVIPAPERLAEPLISIDDATIGYGGHKVLEGVRLQLSPGDRLAILGSNGAGKSTLAGLIAGRLETQGGSVVRSPWLRIGHFAQHQVETLDPHASALGQLRRLAPQLSEKDGRDYLALWQFRGEKALEPTGPFSGGEKARLALALLVHSRPNLLLLDEPTNHLDLDLRHALEVALQDYPGALVLISHDRRLVDSCCNSLWRVAHGRLQPFDGDMDDYARWLIEEQATGSETRGRTATQQQAALPPREQRRVAAARRASLKPLREAVARAERNMESSSGKLAAIAERLADPASYATGSGVDVATLGREQKLLQDQLAAAEEAWLAASDALEKARQG